MTKLPQRLVAFFTLLVPLLVAPTFGQDLRIDSIIRARITADGDVSGRATDFLINLDLPRDNRDGWTLPAGDMIEIILPPEFVNDRQVTNRNSNVTSSVGTDTVFTSSDCAIGNFFCNTSVFVQGWPQRPLVTVLPPAGRGSPPDFTFNTEIYTLSQGATENVFVHTAVQDVGPGSPPPGPGIKQIHMITPGFSNPIVDTPTDFEIVVRHTRKDEDGVVQVIQETSGPFTVIPDIQPSINLTSIYDMDRNNTVYQEIMPGQTPFAYEFFLWDGDGGAYEGVTIDGNDMLDGAGRKIGQVSISAPDGATGQTLTTAAPSFALDGGDIFFGLPTARLTAQLTPGDMPGEYVTTIEMFNKEDIGLDDPRVYSSEVLTVRVVPEPASIVGLLSGIVCLGVFRRRQS